MIKQTGFTLIEVIIVVVILSILIAMVGPNVIDMVKNNRLRGQAFEIMNSINLARSEAVKQKMAVSLCRSADPAATTPTCGGTANTWTTGFLVFTDVDRDGVYDSGDGDTIARRGVISSGGDMSIITNSVSNNNLQFAPDGTTLESGTAKFAICDERGNSFGRLISVPAVGRPKLELGSEISMNCTSPS